MEELDINRINECECTYYSDNFYYIDAWCPDEDEGAVVAVIHKSGDVYEIYGGIRHSVPIVREVCDEVIDNIRKYGWITKGTKVWWNDPAILDYDEQDRAEQCAKVWTVMDDDIAVGINAEDIIVTICDEDGGQSEVFLSELEQPNPNESPAARLKRITQNQTCSDE